MTEPTELMPCPFCGGNARKVKHSAGSPGTIGYDRWHGVACAGCNACVGARDRRFRTSAAAIAAWNTRTPQPTQAQAGAVPLTCEWTHNDDDGYWDTSCGKAWRFDDGGPKENNMNFCHCCGKTLRIKGGQHGTE